MKVPRFVAISALVGFGLIAGFCVVEGTSSLALFTADILLHPSTFARFRMVEPVDRYDPELGWVSRRDLSLPDHFGPGISLRTNTLGFRGDREVGREAPRDRLRVICSGDSFTFGYGVGDDHTWCHRLASMDHRFDAVNMGQEGYGIDQAYLWYVRAGKSLEHAVHVFALITPDFYRMGRSSFFGYAKPTLALEKGALVTRNVPVPKSRFAFYLSPLLLRLDAATERLRAAELVKRVYRRASHASAHDADARFDAKTWEVAAKIFETLQEMNRASGSALMIVYLPMGADYMTHGSDPWRERLRAESERDGFCYLDLVPALRDLPGQQMTSLFLSKTSPGGGHYSNEGHDWVARKVHEALLRLPPVAARLQGPEPPPSADRRTTAPHAKVGNRNGGRP